MSYAALCIRSVTSYVSLLERAEAFAARNIRFGLLFTADGELRSCCVLQRFEAEVAPREAFACGVHHEQMPTWSGRS